MKDAWKHAKWKKTVTLDIIVLIPFSSIWKCRIGKSMDINTGCQAMEEGGNWKIWSCCLFVFGGGGGGGEGVMEMDSGEGCTELWIHQNHPRSRISPSSHFRRGGWLWPHLHNLSAWTPSSYNSTTHSKSLSQALLHTQTHSFLPLQLHNLFTLTHPQEAPGDSPLPPQTLPCPTLSTCSLLPSSKKLP